MTDTARQPNLIVNLVHGTWGRGFFPRRSRLTKSYWFETGSPFLKNLTAALDETGVSHDLVPFEWSGSNSIRARDEAAQRLADRLSQQRDQSQCVNVLTIAHSHGGNVALRACQILVDKHDEDDASNALSKMCIVTLATPFVGIFRMPNIPSDRFWYGFFYIVGMVAIAYGSFVWFTDLPEGSVYALIGGLIALLFLITFVSPYIIKPIFAGFFGPPDQHSMVALDRKIDALVSASFYRSVAAPLRLLVLRGVDDEASMLLTAGSIGVRLSNLLMSLIKVGAISIAVS